MPQVNYRRYWLIWLGLCFVSAPFIISLIPLPKPLFNTSYSHVLLSQEGKLLGAHIATDEQWRFPPNADIPEKFSHALIAFEDKRFYEHWGLDPIAIARATLHNIQAQRIVSGGSTLTMQVARLANTSKERSLKQKLYEASLALRLEQSLSKNEILRLYASHAPFGGNVVGLEAAAWRYFGRNPNSLTWAESATLAVLPNSPALIHPGRNREHLRKKRNFLLNKLYQTGKIDRINYELALAETLPQKPHPLPNSAPHLLDTLSTQYAPKNQFHFDSTIQHELQQRLYQLAKRHAEHLSLADIHNFAILVIDNHKQETIAYLGNSPSPTKKEHGLAIDLINRPRSTGSTLKPFLFASMIQQGEITPESLVADVPIHYSGFMPKNYDRRYRGAVPAKQVLIHSLNIPAVNLLSRHGVARFQAFLKQMGMNTLHRTPEAYGLSLVLGGAEGTLWELTSMYANLSILAQQQARTPLHYHPIKKLRHEPTKQEKTAEISPATALLTLNSLLDVSRPGIDGNWKKFSSSRKVAWKTGTSFGHRDAWAIGTTPKYTVGVWVGNAEGDGRPELTGTQIAAPILFDTFNLLPKQQTWFKKQEPQFKTISLCKKDGYLASKQCPSIAYDIPIEANFTQLSPYYQKIHLDPSKTWRVHDQCESPYKMQHVNWFILPPDQAHYYQQHHADYEPLPPYRADCKQLDHTKHKPFSLTYPKNGTQIYIPRELNGKAGKVVFKAIHEQRDHLLFWHLDDRYLGTTQTFHQKAVHVSTGKHTLTVIDETGNRDTQTFTVLSQ